MAVVACLAAAGMAGTGAPAAEALHGPPPPAGQAVPLPIAGGTKVPGGPLIHVFAPGPKGRSLPFSKFPLGGLNQDPSTIGNFSGTAALAFLVGTARDSTGKLYNLEADMRAFRGVYIASDGKRRFGTFAFI
jgi:hypothetical protein